jgi:hypothetical protein
MKWLHGIPDLMKYVGTTKIGFSVDYYNNNGQKEASSACFETTLVNTLTPRGKYENPTVSVNLPKKRKLDQSQADQSQAEDSSQRELSLMYTQLSEMKKTLFSTDAIQESIKCDSDSMVIKYTSGLSKPEFLDKVVSLLKGKAFYQKIAKIVEGLVAEIVEGLVDKLPVALISRQFSIDFRSLDNRALRIQRVLIFKCIDTVVMFLYYAELLQLKKSPKGLPTYEETSLAISI